MLADSKIRRMRLIEPFNLEQLQPASYDVALGPRIILWRNQYKHKFSLNLEGSFDLLPGDFALASTVETIYLPPNVGAVIDGKSSLGRLGLSVHQTAGYLDPGFCGQITLELSNSSPVGITLIPKMLIGQLRFFKITGKVERPYNRIRNHYQNQVGPTESRYNASTSNG